MSDDENQRTRKPLGLKRSVDAGEVKQTFSHGRTNKVVVEVKRRRVLGKPGSEAAAPPPRPRRRRHRRRLLRPVRLLLHRAQRLLARPRRNG
jgi:hypothetical protein